MKHLLSLAFAWKDNNFDTTFEFQGESIRLTQISTDFSPEMTEDMIRHYDGRVDAICLSGIPPVLKTGKKPYVHPMTKHLRFNVAKESPVVNGETLKNVYLPWALRQFAMRNPQAISKKRIAFYTGALQQTLVDTLAEFGNTLFLGDPYFFMKAPFVLNSPKALERIVGMVGPIIGQRRPGRHKLANFSDNPGGLLKDFLRAEVFVGNDTIFSIVDHEHLKGKTVLSDFVGPKLTQQLKDAGVKEIIQCVPQVIDNPYVNYSILEGIFQSFNSFDGGTLTQDHILSWMDELNMEPEVVKFENTSVVIKEVDKFAFIVHPLSASFVFKHPLLKVIRPYSKPIEGLTEDLIATTPGFFYGKIKGIKSEKNNKELEGLIYTMTETPKKLMEKDPDVIYKKLVDLAKKAEGRGAGIIGLGAYTKIVGDAGVTVSNQSPIPVTTGNSLSACSTLWAAKYALDKLNLIKKQGDRYLGRAMIVGATGSIGAVTAKVLALTWKQVILVAPRAYKLLELKKEIEELAPDCDVVVSTKPDEYSTNSDLIITTTSAQGKKILEIERVKPGCVICDVSRPFDVSEEDAIKRPDVLVIASGEVELPGEVSFNMDLGLEGNVVYACLAETALLALDGRLEAFTLGRDIDYQKVLEIDKMAREHGVRLSEIMGHHGVLSDEDYELCREHALRRLGEE